MHDGILPKLALKYKPVGKRSRDRPKKEIVLGIEVRNTGLINLVNNSGGRRRTQQVPARI
jgi:hypothetical protein